MKRWSIMILVCLMLISCTPTPTSEMPTSVPIIEGSSSGSVVHLTVQELTGQSQLILIGNVGDLQSNWNEDHTYIFTDVSIVPERWIKNEISVDPIVIRIPGGEVEGTTLNVSDTASFRQGERVVLFLIEVSGIYELVGGFQGKFLIENGYVFVDGKDETLDEFVRFIQTTLESSK